MSRVLSPSVSLTAVALLALMVGLPGLGGAFLSWDDPLYITENARVQVETVAGVVALWSPRAALAGEYIEFFPLRDSVYATLHALVGLEPWAYHVVQLCWHAAVSVLVAVLGRRLAGPLGGLVAGLLFAAHPVHVESVAWVSTLKDPMFTSFVLVSVLCWDRYRDSGGWKAYVGAMVALMLALLCKALAIVTPVLFLVVDHVLRRRPLSPRGLAELALPGLITAGMLGLFLKVGAANAVIIEPPGGTALTGAMTMTTVVAGYLGKLVLPWPLSARYVVPPVLQATDPRLLASLAVLVAAVGAAVSVQRRSRWPLFVLAWMLVALLPVLNIVPIPIEMADRYLYLPSVGAAVAAGAGVAALWKSRELRRVAVGLPAAAVLGWSVLSVQRAAVWQSDLTLWSDVVDQAPDFYIGRTSLARAHLVAGDLDAAEEQLSIVLAQAPHHGTAWLNWGVLHQRRSDLDTAAAAFARAAELEPTYAKAWSNLGTVHLARGDAEAARTALESAIAIEPLYGLGHLNLAVACLQLGDRDCVRAHGQRASDLRPADRAVLIQWLHLAARAGTDEDYAAAVARAERYFAEDDELQGLIEELNHRRSWPVEPGEP